MLPSLLPLPLLRHAQAEQDTRMAAVGKSKLNFNLTPEMIAQIFAERPHVKTAFLNVWTGVWVWGSVGCVGCVEVTDHYFAAML